VEQIAVSFPQLNSEKAEVGMELIWRKLTNAKAFLSHGSASCGGGRVRH